MLRTFYECFIDSFAKKMSILNLQVVLLWMFLFELLPWDYTLSKGVVPSFIPWTTRHTLYKKGQCHKVSTKCVHLTTEGGLTVNSKGISPLANHLPIVKAFS